MYFVHEYDSTEFSTFEECAESLREFIDMDDIIGNLSVNLDDIITKFCRRKNDNEFISWMEDKILDAEQSAEEDLITEYEEGEVE